MKDLHRFGDEALSATISAEGAELRSLRDPAGQEWLWQAGPEWPRHAPVLFPIVGRLSGDRLRHGGVAHRLTQHGFARDSRFDWVGREANGCHLRLADSAATRDVFPFPFVLDMEWRVGGRALACIATVTNPGKTPLPFSIGAHPAFAWPLPGAASREGHSLLFPGLDQKVLAARRLTDGLVDARENIPLKDGTLPVQDSLFERDAIVLPGFPGRRIRFSSGNAALELEWEGYGDLGLWSKPGAGFLCLEPWCGTAAPLGWDGEFSSKPGIRLLEAGRSTSFRWSVRPLFAGD
ncbi:aldose 1-epimerase family protein [Roseomonas sp. GCM10028921]